MFYSFLSFYILFCFFILFYFISFFCSQSDRIRIVFKQAPLIPSWEPNRLKLGLMAINEYSTLHRGTEIESHYHYQNQLSVLPTTPFLGGAYVLPHSREYSQRILSSVEWMTWFWRRKNYHNDTEQGWKIKTTEIYFWVKILV